MLGKLVIGEVKDMQNARGRLVRPSYLAALLLVIPGLCQVAVAAQEWETRHNEDGVKIHTKAIEDSGVEVIKGTMDVPWSPEEVAGVIFNAEAQRKYLVGIKELKVLGETTTAKGKKVRTIYQRTSHPGIDDRDVVLKFSSWSKPGKRGDVWHVKFKSVKQKSGAKDGIVQISKLSGGWTISPHPSGKGSRIVYRCHAEIGGNVPDFMVNAGQVDNLLEMLANARAEMKKALGAAK